jgi:hypothetical protein
LGVADNHGTTNCPHFFFSDGFEDHLRADAGRVSHRNTNPRAVRRGLRKILIRAIH